MTHIGKEENKVSIQLEDSKPKEIVRRCVKLNVGGEIFNTLRTTLQKSSFLTSLLGSALDENGMIFIDRDPQLFRHVLSGLRTGKIFLDSEVPEQAVRGEVDYFQLEGISFIPEKEDDQENVTRNEQSFVECDVDDAVGSITRNVKSGKVYRSIGQPGKVKSQTPKVEKQEKKKRRKTGRARMRNKNPRKLPFAI